MGPIALVDTILIYVKRIRDNEDLLRRQIESAMR